MYLIRCRKCVNHTLSIFVVNVERWERNISDEEDILAKCLQNETKQREAIEEDKTQIEQLKNEKQEKKKIADQMEKDTNKARHDVAALAKEVYNINYQISSIDTKIETKKNERHNILIQNKVNFTSHHNTIPVLCNVIGKN